MFRVQGLGMFRAQGLGFFRWDAGGWAVPEALKTMGGEGLRVWALGVSGFGCPRELDLASQAPRSSHFPNGRPPTLLPSNFRLNTLNPKP